MYPDTKILIGKYGILLTQHTQWAVLDFRGTGKEVRREPQPHTYHLSFVDNFQTVMVHQPTGDVLQFTLQGDEVCLLKVEQATLLTDCQGILQASCQYPTISFLV